MENIYATHGNIAKKDLYVRRNKLEQELCDRVLNNDFHGSVSIVGLPRMGKSSLVYNTIIAEADELYKNNIIVIDLQMNLDSTPEIFLKKIVDEVYNLLEENDDIDERITAKYNKVKETSIEDGCVTHIQFFFRTILKRDKRVICVIDEFDNSRKVFEKFSEGFTILRELASQPKTDVTFIFVSRRMITELESASDISTLAGILGNPIYVQPYSKEEIELYHKRSEKYGINLSEEEKNKVLELTGGQPYWLDMLLYNYVNVKKNNDKQTLEEIFDNISGTLYDLYEKILDTLSEQGLLNKLYQIIFGPADDYTIADVKKLQDYGFIKMKDGKAELFSEKLYEYMLFKSKSVNFYPLWNETEHKLRFMLKSCLNSKYGENWEQQLDSYKDSNTEIDNCKTLGSYISDAILNKNRVKKQPKIYNAVMTYTIVEGLTTSGIFVLYKYEPFYEHIIKDIKEFDRIARHLCRARNPYQHNTDDFLTPDFKEQTKIYCKMIKKKIEEWEKTLSQGNKA